MPKRGEFHHHANLTDDEVIRMRAIYSEWKKEGLRLGYKSLGRKFNTPWATVRDIVTNRTRVGARRARSQASPRMASFVAASLPNGSGSVL